MNYGLNDMPAFPDLTDRLLNNLLLYLGNPASAPDPIVSPNEPPATTGSDELTRYFVGMGPPTTDDPVPLHPVLP